MIIDDPNERTLLKSPETASTLHGSLESQAASSPSPPPYVFPHVSYQAISPPLAPRIMPRKKSRLRLGRHKTRKYFIVASVALNCLFFLLWIRIIHGKDNLGGRSEHHADDSDIPHEPIRAVVPSPSLGRCVRNVTWTNTTRLSAEEEFVFSSDASFELQNPSSLLFLLSQGALSGGHLEVVSSSQSVPVVLITARYHSRHVRDRANVCWMERKRATGEGVGIFTPTAFDGQTAEDRIDFAIKLLLPSGSGSSLPIYNLETHLPSFSHAFDSLRNVLEFDHLVLHSQNEPITAKSLFARNATVQTSNALISGTFDASMSLKLLTSNAPIDATVNLRNQNIFTTSELVIQTRNAQLETDVNLMTSSASGQGGKFAVKAETSDGPLIMSFPASPTRSVLNLDAQTSNSAASVWLNHAFEGDFTLSSSMIFVDRRPFLDPKKLRSVFYGDYQNGMVVGNVRWKLPVFKSKIQGSARIATTNNILKLYV
ncbi:Ankyrin repeat family protein [Mycena sanguinolenta]|uniref:Ankyrin repeat family protein n=1 Tax=Mycena sanguinolenta TaxID=230812 RepID=A0A8H6XZ30_9AGAR|nr:Ankyrin repeat family protein [Mycena sanguinolenta]